MHASTVAQPGIPVDFMASKWKHWKDWLLLKPKSVKRFYSPRLEILEDRTTPALAGALDPLFGVGGVAYAQFSGLAQSYGIYRDALTDNIYAAGFTANPTTGDDFALARFNSSGFDSSFALVSTDIQNGSNDRANAITGNYYYGDGTNFIGDGQLRVVLVGSSFNVNTGTNDLAIARYMADGTLDTAFNGTGTVTINLSPYETANAYRVIFDPTTGKTLIAGESNGSESSSLLLARFNFDGSLDASFAANGFVFQSFGFGTSATGLAIDTNGDIIVSGTTFAFGGSSNDFFIAKYSSSGFQDTGFGSDSGFASGVIIIDLGANTDDLATSLVIDGQNNIIVGGTVQNGTSLDFGFVRVDVDGNFDPTTGKAIIPTVAGQDDVLNDLAIDSFGRIIAVGTTQSGSRQTVVARLYSDFTLDSTFGTGGVTVIAIPTAPASATDDARAVTLDGSGKILVAGSTQLGGQRVFDVLRLTAETTASTSVVLPDIAEDSGDYLILGDDLTGGDIYKTLIGVSDPIGGTVVFDGTNVTFTPTADFNGPAGFSFTVVDPETRKPTIYQATFQITEVNDAPTAQNQTLSPFDAAAGSLIITPATLLQNSSPGPANESGQTVSVAAVYDVVGGTLSIVNGNVVFTPTSGFSGVVSFSFIVLDNGTTAGVADPRAAAATVSFNVTAAAPPADKNPTSDPPTTGDTLPPAATSPSSSNPTPRTTSNIILLLSGDGNSVPVNGNIGGNASSNNLSEFEKSIRLVAPPSPLRATALARAGGDFENRIAVVVQMINDAPERRPAAPTIGLTDNLSANPQGPGRSRLLQIVTSQFDGEDNVWIIEGLLRDQAGPANIRPAGFAPGKAAPPVAPAVPGPAAEQSSLLEPVKRYGAGLMLFLGLVANIALLSDNDKPLFPATPRKRRNKT